MRRNSEPSQRIEFARAEANIRGDLKRALFLISLSLAVLLIFVILSVLGINTSLFAALIILPGAFLLIGVALACEAQRSLTRLNKLNPACSFPEVEVPTIAFAVSANSSSNSNLGSTVPNVQQHFGFNSIIQEGDIASDIIMVRNHKVFRYKIAELNRDLCQCRLELLSQQSHEDFPALSDNTLSVIYRNSSEIYHVTYSLTDFTQAQLSSIGIVLPEVEITEVSAEEEIPDSRQVAFGMSH